jgi:seryl-tRNA synthetase
MPTLQELSDKVDELQVSLDAEQVAIQAAIDALTAVAADLQTQLDAAVAAGGTDADRQALLDKINSIKTDLEATIA